MISDETKLELEQELDLAQKEQANAQEWIDGLSAEINLWLDRRDKADARVRALEVLTYQTAVERVADGFKTFGED